MNVLLTAILLTNLVLIGIVLYAFLRISRVYKTFIDFITPAREGEPSALALTASNMADMLARSLIAQVKAYLMGLQSGTVRADNAEAFNTAVEVAGSANPLIGAVVNIPGVKKLLKKNPGLLDLAIQQFMKSRGPGSVPSGPSAQPGQNHAQNQTSFKI